MNDQGKEKIANIYIFSWTNDKGYSIAEYVIISCKS